jgi:hypothetical protein
MNKKIIFISAVLILVETVIHFYGVFFFGYINFWWLDILTHFIGGFWLSLTAIWFFWFSGYLNLKKSPTFLKVLLSGIFAILVVAFLWESFELAVGINYFPEGYMVDTMFDVVMGTLGGILSSITIAYLWQKNLN